MLLYGIFFPLEREENVKADIFAAYRALLNRTKPLSSSAKQPLSEGDAMETADRLVTW